VRRRALGPRLEHRAEEVRVLLQNGLHRGAVHAADAELVRVDERGGRHMRQHALLEQAQHRVGRVGGLARVDVLYKRDAHEDVEELEAHELRVVVRVGLGGGGRAVLEVCRLRIDR
jgi:hypothetical protein